MDYITPVPLLFAGSNIVILALLAVLPVLLVRLLLRRVLGDSGGKPAVYQK